MPIIEVHLLEGYTADDRRRLSEGLTDAVRLVVPAPADAVTIILHEMPHDNYYRGRTTRTPAKALPDPCLVVEQFLSHLGARELDRATAYLADTFVMYFPGSEPMHTLQELMEWSKPRYRSIAKQIEGIEALRTPGDATVVYCRGTLSGVWPDGSTFKDIRFIDRFEIVDGLIIRQDVWNDLAEVRAR